MTADPRLATALALIDRVNAGDPNRTGGEPRALIQGRAADRWVIELGERPSPELRLAARAHHLRRWEIARASYPAGRPGYLRWRQANKAHQADAVAPLLRSAGYGEPFVQRVQEILGRQALGRDRDVQALEDAACLVFIQTQLAETAERLDPERLAGVLAKTLAKISPAAVVEAERLLGAID